MNENQLKSENEDLQRALQAVEKHLETTLGKLNFLKISFSTPSAEKD